MKRCLAVAVAAAALAAAACEASSPTATLSGFHVGFQPGAARLSASAPDGTAILEGIASQIQLRHADATYEMQFGSFRILEPSADPWTDVASLGALTTTGPASFELRGKDGGLLGQGTVASEAEGELTITLSAAAGSTANRMSLAYPCHAGEHFMGMGGQSFDVDHGGQSVPLWVQEDGVTKVQDDSYDTGIWIVNGRRHSTHTPMPMFVSSRGYGLMLDSPMRSIFHLCSDDDRKDAVRIEAWDKTMVLRLFAGPTPKQVIERMTRRVGRPPVPPAFAFAPWLDAIFGSANVRRVAAHLRAAHVPTSVIWTEDWRGGADNGNSYVLAENWQVDRTLYPDFEQLATDLHNQGFKFLTYENSFLTRGVDVFDPAIAGGYEIKTAAGAPYIFTGSNFEDASLVDFTSPAAWTWTKQQYTAGLRLGADGYMADFAEWLPTDAVLASGESAERYHNLYPVDWARLNQEVMDEMGDGVERLFFLRAAYPGSQPLVSVVWAGDQVTDFSLGDGMPSVIPIGIGLGATGFPYFAHDIGGYTDALSEGPTTKELFFRWVELAALSPVMRTHHGRAARKNWNWESDDDSVAHLARWATLHMKLFPYLMAMAAQAAAHGTPMFRALALEYPSFQPGWTATDQFMLGDRLIVLPVISDGARMRTAELPGGTFYPLQGGPALTVPAAGGQVTLQAALGDLPVLVPAGTLLALLPDGVDTLVAAPGGGLTTLADVHDDRELWLWPGGSSSLDESPTLSYRWQAAGLHGAVTAATWNGAPVTVADPLLLTGPGTLLVNGGAATLTVTGGAPDRKLTVRLRGL